MPIASIARINIRQTGANSLGIMASAVAGKCSMFAVLSIVFYVSSWSAVACAYGRRSVFNASSQFLDIDYILDIQNIA